MATCRGGWSVTGSSISGTLELRWSERCRAAASTASPGPSSGTRSRSSRTGTCSPVTSRTAPDRSKRTVRIASNTGIPRRHCRSRTSRRPELVVWTRGVGSHSRTSPGRARAPSIDRRWSRARPIRVPSDTGRASTGRTPSERRRSGVPVRRLRPAATIRWAPGSPSETAEHRRSTSSVLAPSPGRSPIRAPDRFRKRLSSRRSTSTVIRSVLRSRLDRPRPGTGPIGSGGAATASVQRLDRRSRVRDFLTRPPIFPSTERGNRR